MCELSSQSRDAIVLTVTQTGFHDSSMTQKSRKSAWSERKKARTEYYFLGKPVCADIIAYLHCIGSCTLKKLVCHFRSTHL